MKLGKIPKYLGALLVTLLLVAACAADDDASGGDATDPADPGGATDDGAVQEGGLLRIGLPRSIVTLDPQFAFDSYSVKVIDQVFDTLVGVDADGTITPRLATEWSVSDDDLTWEFTIRDGVTFHNGREMTADDVTYTMQRMLDPATEVPRQQLPMVESVETVDESTVRFNMAEPSGPFLNRLTHRALSIVPAEVIDELGADDFARSPVGTGPFSFVSWQGDTVRLEANPDYFFGTPNLDGVEFRVIPETAVAQQQLETGEIDVVEDVLPDEIGRLEAEGLVQYEPGLSYYYIVFNQHPTAGPLADQLGENPLTDARVREALTIAFDVDEAVEAVYPGLGDVIRAHGPIPQGNWAYDESLAATASSPDLDRARELLAEAGYPDGFSVNLLVMSDAARQAIGQIYQNALGQIGVDASIEMPEFSVLLDQANAQTFDIGVFGWSGSPDPHEYLYPLLHTDSRGPGGNNAYFSDPAIDALIDDGSESSVVEDRAEMYREVQQIVAGQFVHIPLFYRPSLLGLSPSVVGLDVDPFGYYPLVTATANVGLATG